MRYWGILAAKVVGAALFLCAVWYGLLVNYTRPEYHDLRSKMLVNLGWTGSMLLFSLLVHVVILAIIWDQRYRCRTCGRRLRMPVQTGRYAQMLLHGRPKLEYICTYGHGTLKVAELQFMGKEPPDWQANEDIWKELYSLDDAPKR